MLSSIFKPKKGRRRHHDRERSPFSSPYSDRIPPIAARRSEPEERRRVTADFEDEEGDEDEDEEEASHYDEDESDGDEDGDEDHDATPLLPIFEASQLGTARPSQRLSTLLTFVSQMLCPSTTLLTP